MAGTITPYETANGKRYRVRYRKPDRTQTDKRGFTTKREAQQYLASVTVSKSTGQYIDPTAGKVTVGELAEAWLASKSTLKPSTLRPMEISWRLHVAPTWAEKPICDVLPSEVEAWVAGLAEIRSASVVHRCIGILAGILDVAVRDRRISTNPARGITNRPRKISHKKRRYLSVDELHEFADSTTTDLHHTVILTLGYCGLRWSELAGLQVSDLNEVRRRLNISRAAVEVDGKIVVGAPKSWAVRSVPYPKLLSPELHALTEGKHPEDLLFGVGEHIRLPRSDHSWFLAALRRAGLERLTPHDLRHTAASLAISAGANAKAVQRVLGHSSAAMTLDTYADLFDTDLDDVAERLNGLRLVG